MNEPGISRTIEPKSSAPAIGVGHSIHDSSPQISLTTLRTRSVVSGSFMTTSVANLPISYSTSSPKALAIPSKSSPVYCCTCSSMPGLKVRTVAPKLAVLGTTLVVWSSPALIQPTLITTGSKALKRLLTMVCRALIASVIAETGSFAIQGLEPWPPRPLKVTSMSLAEAISAPDFPPKVLGGCQDDVT